MRDFQDRLIIFVSASLRACAVSFSGVILALHLSAMGWNSFLIGGLISFGLMGSALATLMVIFLSEKIKKKTSLIGISFLMGFGGLAFALTKNSAVLMAAALLGVVNGMGRDRGASMTLEQAVLPEMATDREHTQIFAWYNVFVDVGNSIGALAGLAPAIFRSHGMTCLFSYQGSWGIYSCLCFGSGLLLLGLSKSVDPEGPAWTLKLSPSSRSIITKFAALSGLDSLGGGFLTTAMIGFWFFKRFGTDETVLAQLFFLKPIFSLTSLSDLPQLEQPFRILNSSSVLFLYSKLSRINKVILG